MRFDKRFTELRREFLESFRLANPQPGTAAKSELKHEWEEFDPGIRISGLLRKVMLANKGKLVPIPKEITRNSGTGDARMEAVGVKMTSDFMKEMVARGLHPFPGKDGFRNPNGKGMLLPFMDKPVSKAIEHTFGIPLDKLAILKGTIEICSKDDMEAFVERCRNFMDEEDIEVLIDDLNDGAIVGTADTVKFNLHEKLHKLGSYSRQPFGKVIVDDVLITLVPKEVNMDGVMKTFRMINKEFARRRLLPSEENRRGVAPGAVRLSVFLKTPQAP